MARSRSPNGVRNTITSDATTATTATTSAAPVTPGDEETTTARVQSTYVWQNKRPFPARYSGPNSLSPAEEISYTFTATAFLGLIITMPLVGHATWHAYRALIAPRQPA